MLITTAAPTISVITPSFNQGAFLGDCIRSVAEQTFPATEHLILDPGSTDDSRAIAAAAAGVTLIAEADDGQADAICRGFARARGDVLCWLNSDDQFHDSSALRRVAETFAENPVIDVVYGRGEFVDEAGDHVRDYYVNPDDARILESFQHQVGVCQPAAFLRRRVFEAVGGPSVELDFQLDYEYWIRIAKAGFRWRYVPELLAKHRWWPGMKTYRSRDQSLTETLSVVKSAFGYVHYKWAERTVASRLEGLDGIVNVGGASVERLEVAAAQLLREVNSDYAAVQVLNGAVEGSGPSQTLRYMQALGGAPICPAIPRAGAEVEPDALRIDMGGGASPVDLVRVGEQAMLMAARPGVGWMFDYNWFRGLAARQIDALAALANEKRGEVCVLVADSNLPAEAMDWLDGVDIALTANALRNPWLRSNGRYLVVADEAEASEAGRLSIGQDNLRRIAPWWLRPLVAADDGTAYLNVSAAGGFSSDASRSISGEGGALGLALQVLYTLGYGKVLVLGGATASPEERLWLGQAREAYEADHRRIVACTPAALIPPLEAGDLFAELSARGVAAHQSVALRGDLYKAVQPGARAAGVSIDGASIGVVISHLDQGDLQRTLQGFEGSGVQFAAVGDPGALGALAGHPKIIPVQIGEGGVAAALGDAFRALEVDVLAWLRAGETWAPDAANFVSGAFAADDAIRWLVGYAGVAQEGRVAPRRDSLRPISWARALVGDTPNFERCAVAWRRSGELATGAERRGSGGADTEASLWAGLLEDDDPYIHRGLIGVLQDEAAGAPASSRLWADAMARRRAFSPPALRRRYGDIEVLPGGEAFAVAAPLDVLLDEQRGAPRAGSPAIARRQRVSGEAAIAYNGAFADRIRVEPPIAGSAVKDLVFRFRPVRPMTWRHDGTYGQHYPPMPLLAGPIALRQTNEARYEVEIKGEQGVETAVFLVPRRVEEVRVQIVFDGEARGVWVNGRRIAASAPALGDEPITAVQLGRGHLDRFAVIHVVELELHNATGDVWSARRALAEGRADRQRASALEGMLRAVSGRPTASDDLTSLAGVHAGRRGVFWLDQVPGAPSDAGDVVLTVGEIDPAGRAAAIFDSQVASPDLLERLRDYPNRFDLGEAYLPNLLLAAPDEPPIVTGRLTGFSPTAYFYDAEGPAFRADRLAVRGLPGAGERLGQGGALWAVLNFAALFGFSEIVLAGNSRRAVEELRAGSGHHGEAGRLARIWIERLRAAGVVFRDQSGPGLLGALEVDATLEGVA